MVQHNCTLCNYQDDVVANYRCDFTDSIVEQQVVHGLANDSHRQKLLVRVPEMNTLDEKFRFLKLLQETERSTHLLEMSSLSDHSRQEMRSTYKANKRCKCGQLILSGNPNHSRCSECQSKFCSADKAEKSDKKQQARKCTRCQVILMASCRGSATCAGSSTTRCCTTTRCRRTFGQ